MIFKNTRKLAGYFLRRLQSIHLYRKIAKLISLNIEIKEADEEDMRKYYSWANPGVEFRYSYNAKVTNFVAKKRNEVIGFAQLVDRTEEENSLYPGYWFHSIIVKSIFRGMGIAEALNQRLIEKARQRGAQEVFLVVRENNHNAIKMDYKLGFERRIIPEIEEKLEKQRLPSGERHIFMSKFL